MLKEVVKVFISQPMRDKTDEEILAVRKRCYEKVSNLYDNSVEVIILDTFFSGMPSPEGVNRSLWCLGKSLNYLAEANVAYFAKGWNEYRGCKIEHTCALEYEIPIIEE